MYLIIAETNHYENAMFIAPTDSLPYVFVDFDARNYDGPWIWFSWEDGIPMPSHQPWIELWKIFTIYPPQDRNFSLICIVNVKEKCN